MIHRICVCAMEHPLRLYTCVSNKRACFFEISCQIRSWSETFGVNILFRSFRGCSFFPHSLFLCLPHALTLSCSIDVYYPGPYSAVSCPVLSCLLFSSPLLTTFCLEIHLILYFHIYNPHVTWWVWVTWAPTFWVR